VKCEVVRVMIFDIYMFKRTSWIIVKSYGFCQIVEKLPGNKW